MAKDHDDEIVVGPDEGKADANSSAGGTAVRTTVSLRDSDVRRMNHLAEAMDLRPNEVFRQALATTDWVQRRLGEGYKILVEDRDGVIREVEFPGLEPVRMPERSQEGG